MPNTAQPKDTPKARRTRRLILDTAMRLFAELGYERAGNAAIAEAAGITRGAMLYYYSTREALVAAAATHIQAARTALFEEAIRQHGGIGDAVDLAIETYWQLLPTEPFQAFRELENAARLDPRVAEAIAPAQAEFDGAAMGQSVPGLIQAGADPRFQVSRDLARFALEGLHHARLTYRDQERAAALIRVLKRAVHMLNRKGDVQDLWPGS